MNKPHLTEQQDLCESYLCNISSRELHNFETDDYLAFYCGLDCYDNWLHLEENLAEEDHSDAAHKLCKLNY